MPSKHPLNPDRASAQGAPVSRRAVPRRAVVGGLASAALARAAPAIAAQPASRPSAAADVAAYGRLPAIFDAALSGSGTKIALGLSTGPVGRVQIADLVTGQTLAGFAANTGQTLREVAWAEDDLAVAVVTQTFTVAQIEAFGWRFLSARRLLEYVRFVAMDLATRKSTMLLDKTEDSEAMVSFGTLRAPIGGDPGFGRIVARTSPLRDAQVGVFRVDLRSGRGSVQRRFPSKTVDVLLSAAGTPIARSAVVDDKADTWDILAIEDRSERVILSGSTEFGIPPDLAGTLPDGRIVIGREAGAAQTYRLSAIDPATGKETDVFASERFDVHSAIVDPRSGIVVGAQWIDDLELRQTFFDATLQAAYEKIRALVPDGLATIHGWSRDKSTVLMSSEHAGWAGGGYFLFSPASGALRSIGRRYPDLRERALVQSIAYMARDGVRVPAILTIPDAPARTPAPLVALIHGGPHARDAANFDWWPQFLAARGYTVLQPNFRGSTGYGRAWRTAGFGQWGGRMSQDVEDGVRALARSGQIDPTRIAFVGASYGAYAALTAGLQAPDLARCVAGVGGVYDLPRLVRDELTGTVAKGMRADFITNTIGALKTDKAALAAVSPTLNASRITAPVLLMHGTEDSVVDILQTRGLRNALTAAGRSPTYVELKGDDHWLSDGATRTRMLEELDRFLATHLA